MQDFFTFFAKIRDDDRVAVNYLRDVEKNIVDVDIYSTIKEEVTKPKKRTMTDVETTTPKKLRRHVGLVDYDVLIGTKGVETPQPSQYRLKIRVF